MGQRANLIVVENNRYTLFYDHWAANSLDSYLFWGPEQAVTYIREHEKSGEDWWLDTVWCEGGAVVDLDNKVLLFFGGEDSEYEVPLRRMYFQLLPYLWPGYELRWTHRGIIDLANYVGYDTDKVTDKDHIHSPTKEALVAAFERDREDDLEGVLSIRKNDTLMLYPIYGFVDGNELLFVGEGLIDFAARQKGHTSYRYPDLSKETYTQFAKTGIHLDADQKKLSYWTASPSTTSNELLQPFWNGWEINYWGDDYAAQELLTGNKLAFPIVEESLVLEQIRNIVCRPYRRGDGFAKELFEKLSAEGKKVEVNPAIYATSLFDMPVTLREQIFDQVVERWKRG